MMDEGDDEANRDARGSFIGTTFKVDSIFESRSLFPHPTPGKRREKGAQQLDPEPLKQATEADRTNPLDLSVEKFRIDCHAAPFQRAACVMSCTV